MRRCCNTVQILFLNEPARLQQTLATKMDGLLGPNGFTIPAEVNVRLLPLQSRLATEDQHLTPRVLGVESSTRGQECRQLYTPSNRAAWATPPMSVARFESAETRRRFEEPPGRRYWEGERSDDGRRDSRTEAWSAQHTFPKPPERRNRESSEDYDSYRAAATVMRDQQYAPPTSASSYADPQRRRLVTDQADYEIIKPLRSTTGSLSHEELYLIEDCNTKELFVQKRLRMTTTSSRERARQPSATHYCRS